MRPDRAAAIHAPATAAAWASIVLGHHLRLEAEPPHPRSPQTIHHPMSCQRSRRFFSGLGGSGGLTSITTSTRSGRPRGHVVPRCRTTTSLSEGGAHRAPRVGMARGGGASSRSSGASRSWDPLGSEFPDSPRPAPHKVSCRARYEGSNPPFLYPGKGGARMRTDRAVQFMPRRPHVRVDRAVPCPVSQGHALPTPSCFGSGKPLASPYHHRSSE